MSEALRPSRSTVSESQPTEPGWSRTAYLLLARLAHDGLVRDSAGALWNVGQPHLPQLHHKQIDSLLFWDAGRNPPEQRVYDRVWALQRGALAEVQAALEAAGVPALTFKGGEYLEWLFGSRGLGILNDLDLLVPRPKIGEARFVLQSLGYRQATYDAKAMALVDLDPLEIARAEGKHYELLPLDKVHDVALENDERCFVERRGTHPCHVRDGGCHLVVRFDVHHQVAADIPSDEFFQRAATARSGLGKTLSDTDHLWFTCCRYYTEVALHGKRSLRDMAYLAALLRQGEIDWDLLCQVAAQYELRPSLFYYLSFLADLGSSIPPRVLDELDPRRGSRLRDFGWQLSPLLDWVDPSPVPSWVKEGL